MLYIFHFFNFNDVRWAQHIRLSAHMRMDPPPSPMGLGLSGCFIIYLHT